MNTTSRVRKVVAAVKEIDIKGKIKLGFSGIIAGGDINKEDDIVSTNNRLKKYCEGNEFFIDNIDASCLNKSKFHLNRKGPYYLANNFSVKREKALECLCTSPMLRATDNDSKTALRLNRPKYSKNIIFSYLNINSVRNELTMSGQL